MRIQCAIAIGYTDVSGYVKTDTVTCRENIIIVKREQIMAETFGHYKIFATLSLSLSQVPTYNSISFIYCPRGRVNIRLSLL